VPERGAQRSQCPSAEVMSQEAQLADAGKLQPQVAEGLIGDNSVLALMGQPKMVDAIRALKEDPGKYNELMAADPELAEMMAALKASISSAEAGAEVAAQPIVSEAMRARDAAIEFGRKSEWQRAVSECESGLRSASGELAHELRALRTRYTAKLSDEARARAEQTARVLDTVRTELADATAAGQDVRRLQAAVDTARLGGLRSDPLLAAAQRLLVQLLEQHSGERMRLIRESARLAAARDAAPSQSAQSAPNVQAATTLDAPPPASAQTGAAAVAPQPDSAPSADAHIRSLVQSNSMLYELD